MFPVIACNTLPARFFQTSMYPEALTGARFVGRQGRAVKVIGEVSDLTLAAIRLGQRNPNRSADVLPYALQLPDFDAREHRQITTAEAAAVRWLELVRSLPGADELERGNTAAVLAWRLAEQGIAALAFDRGGRIAHQTLCDLLGNEGAWQLAERQASRIYVVPVPPWSSADARAIRSDLLRLGTEGCSGQGPAAACAERAELAVHAEMLASGRLY